MLFAPWFEFESAHLGSKVVAGPLLLYPHLASKDSVLHPSTFVGRDRTYVSRPFYVQLPRLRVCYCTHSKLHFCGYMGGSSQLSSGSKQLSSAHATAMCVHPGGTSRPEITITETSITFE